MIDDWLLSLLYAAWLTASTMPLGFMLGSSCSPCCGCGVADGKPRTDPKDEGTWVPSGTWATSVTWTFTANPGDESGETWFFYGSASTSKPGGGASTAEQRDWYNICNWYSNKTTSPSTTSGLPAAFDKRATRLPPPEAVVHIYRSVNTIKVGPATVKNAYFWDDGRFEDASELTCTSPAFDSAGGAVFSLGARNRNGSTINGGARFNDTCRNELSATVNGGAAFYGGASIFDSSLNLNSSTVNGGATFNNWSRNLNSSTVNGGATFNDDSQNDGAGSTVNDGATFNNTSRNNNFAIVNGGATFNDSSRNLASTVNGGATFNDSSRNQGSLSTVNGGATFNDAACSTRFRGGFFASPCSRQFVTHPVDVPTCNGTAPDGCADVNDTCGCG